MDRNPPWTIDTLGELSQNKFLRCWWLTLTVQGRSWDFHLIAADEHSLETKQGTILNLRNLFFILFFHLIKMFYCIKLPRKGLKCMQLCYKTHQRSAFTAQPPCQCFNCLLLIIQIIHYYDYLCCHSVLQPKPTIKSLMRQALWKFRAKRLAQKKLRSKYISVGLLPLGNAKALYAVITSSLAYNYLFIYLFSCANMLH